MLDATLHVEQWLPGDGGVVVDAAVAVAITAADVVVASSSGVVANVLVVVTSPWYGNVAVSSIGKLGYEFAVDKRPADDAAAAAADDDAADPIDPDDTDDDADRLSAPARSKPDMFPFEKPMASASNKFHAIIDLIVKFKRKKDGDAAVPSADDRSSSE